ncbi:hypothetical protein BB934_28285 (plasmid) [Microvirga ossetica]|uniref:Uncharacterized protein n=1 Tax=Microvirga ossetica TaxID=1882682 RepID=A0A1B2EQH9_9HYPH|nr:hypothetical protein BB934_28285 [Microvirga ossetica]
MSKDPSYWARQVHVIRPWRHINICEPLSVASIGNKNRFMAKRLPMFREMLRDHDDAVCSCGLFVFFLQ